MIMSETYKLGRLRQVVCYERFTPSLAINARNQCNIPCTGTPGAATKEIRALDAFYPLLARRFRECFQARSFVHIRVYALVFTRWLGDKDACAAESSAGWPRDAGPGRQARRRRLECTDVGRAVQQRYQRESSEPHPRTPEKERLHGLGFGPWESNMIANDFLAL
jgi:hypothetical protein